jgi:hypothetical protein
MRRRAALALALALTTITTFGLIALGGRGGLFGTSGSDDEAAAASQEDVAAALQYLAAQEPTAAEPAAPQVVTEYVYVDAPADPPQVTYVTRSGAAPGAQTQPTAPLPLAPQATASPVEPDVPLTESPTEIPPPAPPAEPTAPPAEPRSVTGEDEFEGTVVAIDGEMVTFARGGGEVQVRVGDAGSLDVGMTVKVHAIRIGDTWVAKEIEFGD